jgi:hypothetical protein
VVGARTGLGVAELDRHGGRLLGFENKGESHNSKQDDGKKRMADYAARGLAKKDNRGASESKGWLSFAIWTPRLAQKGIEGLIGQREQGSFAAQCPWRRSCVRVLSAPFPRRRCIELPRYRDFEPDSKTSKTPQRCLLHLLSTHPPSFLPSPPCMSTPDYQ